MPCAHTTGPTQLNGAGLTPVSDGPCDTSLKVRSLVRPCGGCSASTAPTASRPRAHTPRGPQVLPGCLPAGREGPDAHISKLTLPTSRGEGPEKAQETKADHPRRWVQGVLVAGLPLKAPRRSDRAGAGPLCCHTVEYYAAVKKDWLRMYMKMSTWQKNLGTERTCGIVPSTPGS